MPFDDQLRADTAPLYTDLYQLTMLQAYWAEDMHANAVFDLFVRRLKHRNFLLACGLEQVLEFLESMTFSEEAIEYLREQGTFDEEFLAWLSDFSFTGDVYAVAEGTPVFPDEPLVEVVAPIGEAQLAETFLLNQLTFQTGAASKAARVVQAATADGTDRLVADFGMRRMHGTDASMKGARAMYIAGVDSTSNVAAGHAYGIPITGTMAHSYVEAHDAEMAAFRNFTRQYPDTVLLVDTYDTMTGIEKVIDLAREWGDDFQVRGVRLDSGDLAELAKQARARLDEEGLDDVMILASSSLDEHKITDLLEQGAPIDGFGVGTRMGTMADQPYLDSAYKLSGYDGAPRMKLAKDKSNLPGRKQVMRLFDDGEATQDVICIAEEAGDQDGTPLLMCVMKDGERTEAGRPRPLDDIRAEAARQVKALPERLRQLDLADPPYDVSISSALENRRDAVQANLRDRMNLPA
ncbi:nicotinate phosphoribosyltransferase [Longibacter salinarum]|uniref:Nicotinate phosphoribosyltransferase n=1 Tax=Longibacter salinarum TaxID=1850348 RepID=A0A2A8CX71_9BACT|nr:nicotinate phosphoribosyltransferase [Longibacter salinarum]PEN13211.1 nicotinate phosphoribosyltransferase [Longibacter salinarum]